jgi:hypothetical protein
LAGALPRLLAAAALLLLLLAAVALLLLLLAAVALLLLLLAAVLRYLSVVEAMLSHLSLVVVHLFLAGALPRLLAAAALLLLLLAAILRHLLAAVTQCFRLLLPPHLAVCLRRRHRHHRQRKHLSPLLAVAPVPGVLGFGSSAAVQHALTVFFKVGHLHLLHCICVDHKWKLPLKTRFFVIPLLKRCQGLAACKIAS